MVESPTLSVRALKTLLKLQEQASEILQDILVEAECPPIVQGLTALIIGLDRRLNLSEEVPKPMCSTEGYLFKHEGDTDALFLTTTKTLALKIRVRIFKVLMASAGSSLQQRLFWCFYCHEFQKMLVEFCKQPNEVRLLIKQDPLMYQRINYCLMKFKELTPFRLILM